MLTVEKVCAWLGEHFEELCNYTFDEVDVTDKMEDYCEKTECIYGAVACWREYLERGVK